MRLRAWCVAHASALILFAACAIVAASRLWMAWTDFGVLWPDEVYQSLEQGHRVAFGYGLVPWEFRDGARSWLFPGVLGAVLKIAAWLGASSGEALVIVGKSFMALLAVASTAAAITIAHRRAGLAAGALTGAWLAVFPPSVVFGSRCFSEMASAPLVTIAALLVLDEGRARRAALAGALLGLAVFCRYQNGLFVVVFLGGLVVTRRFREARGFVAAAVAIGLAGGALDWVTWGKPFASFLLYFRFSVLEGKASAWGTEPATYYARVLFMSTGWPIFVLALGALLALVTRKRSPVLVASVVVYFVVHTFVPHKELRFLLPAVPLFVATSAIGFASVCADPRVRAWATRFDARALPLGLLGIGVAMTIAMQLAVGRESFASMGAPGQGRRSVWHAFEAPTRGLFRAGRRADLCGVILSPDADWGYTFGFTAIHRDVPFFRDVDASTIASANYIIAPRGARLPPAFVQVEDIDTYALYRREGACAPSIYPRNLER